MLMSYFRYKCIYLITYIKNPGSYRKSIEQNQKVV